MKKAVILFSVLLFFNSCNDGDFNVPSFDFIGKPINDCGDSMLLFKINENETLILDTGISNTNDIFFKTARENQEYNLDNKISYRVFNANVNTNYFCQDIPPTSPEIIDEWIGSGTLIVTNTIVDNGDNTSDYTTVFSITNMNLENSNGNKIIHQTYDFETKTGTFTN